MLKKVTLFSLLLLLTTPLSLSAQVGGVANRSLNLSLLGKAISNAVWVVFTVIVIISFVVAGVQFLTARGEIEKLTKARSAAIWGVAGVVVGIIAYSIILILGSSL